MQITEAEWEVMESVWTAESQLPGEILARIDAGGRSHRTLRTLLARLVEKGAVAVTVSGSKHLYSAAVTRDECIRTATQSFSKRFFAGDVKSMLLHFVEHESLSAEELDALRAELDAKCGSTNKRGASKRRKLL